MNESLLLFAFGLKTQFGRIRINYSEHYLDMKRIEYEYL